MNDKPQMMKQQQQPQMINQSQMMINQPQMMNQSQLMNQNSQILNQSQFKMKQPQPQGMIQSQMLSRSYGMWPPQSSMEAMKFPNPGKQGFVNPNQQKVPGRSNWKGKKGIDKRKDGRRKEMPVIAGSGVGGGVVGGVGSSGGGGGAAGGGGGGGGYKPPTLNELQHQNRLKARKFYPKKKYNRFAPFAPRNTTSFIIRAKRSGGIASLVSPCPVTPAVLPTPVFSPSREVLVDMAKEEWGVDGYGSMKGLIRLRSPGHDPEGHEDDEEEEGGSSESDVEEHVEVERRLDHDLSRFEMIYPHYGNGTEYNNLLENRVDDQDTHIAQLEEENLTLKERLFLMERELGDLRRRMQCLERQNHVVVVGMNEEVLENVSENESEGGGEIRSMEENSEEVVEENNEEGYNAEAMEEHNDVVSELGGVGNDCFHEFVHAQDEVIGDDQSKDEDAKNGCPDTIEEGVGDVCREEVALAHNEVTVENQLKGEVARNECSEKAEGVEDMYMVELGNAHDGVVDENRTKDTGVLHDSSKNIDDDDLSNQPALEERAHTRDLKRFVVAEYLDRASAIWEGKELQILL